MPHREKYIELLFHGKTKDFGAYKLKQRSPINTGLSLLTAILVIGGGFLWVYQSSMKEEISSGDTMDISSEESISVNQISAAPIIETKPPPPIAIEQPKVSTVKYLTPVAKPDEEVPEEEIIPTHDELENINAGTSTQEGLDSIVIGVIPDAEPEPEAEYVPPPAKQEPFTIVEEMPVFPGGEEALLQFLAKNIQYPEMAKELIIEGIVYAKFTIFADGTVGDIEIVRGIGGGCDEEVIRVIQSMPDWTPGVQGGMKVPVAMVVPVNFDLTNN